MISTALAAVTAALDAADIYATIDSRNIAAPGCFVNVTKIDEFTLDDSARVTGTIVAVVKDLGARPTSTRLTSCVTTYSPR